MLRQLLVIFTIITVTNRHGFARSVDTLNKHFWAIPFVGIVRRIVFLLPCGRGADQVPMKYLNGCVPVRCSRGASHLRTAEKALHSRLFSLRTGLLNLVTWLIKCFIHDRIDTFSSSLRNYFDRRPKQNLFDRNTLPRRSFGPCGIFFEFLSTLLNYLSTARKQRNNETIIQ